MDSEATHNMVESFQDLDGRRLLQMTLEDFREISEQHGEFLFEIFKKMCTVGKQGLFILLKKHIDNQKTIQTNFTRFTKVNKHKTA